MFLKQNRGASMKDRSSICGVALIVSSFVFCLAGCGVKADRQEHDSTKGAPAPARAQSPTDKSSADVRTARFVGEPTQAPELYSRGSYIDEQHAWVAAGFEVKRTTDGGRTWQLMRPSTESEPVFGKMGGIYVMPSFITPTRGWLNASKGTWQTEDGGLTWRQVFTDRTGNPHFADKQYGWIATYAEKYQESYVTKDGGQTWQPCGARRKLNQQTPGDAFFLTSQLGWA